MAASPGGAGGAASPHVAALAHRIEGTWNNSHGAVRLVGAFPAAWRGLWCRRMPMILVLLYGHYRSHDVVEEHLHQSLAAPSKGCYVVAAFVPVSRDKSSRQGRAPCPSEALTVQARLARSKFAPRTAHAVVRRFGTLDGYADGLALGFTGAWTVAAWAAAVHGVRWADDTVVLRTRPDIQIGAPLDLRALGAFFAHGARGPRVAAAGEFRTRQGDLLLVTSAKAYGDHIVAPFEEALREKRLAEGKGPAAQSTWISWWNLALTNAWGYGRSIANRRPWPGMDDLLRGACACPRARRQAAGACSAPACLLTIIELPMLVWRHINMVRVPGCTAAEPRSRYQGPPVDAAAGVFIYCRDKPAAFGQGRDNKHIVKPYFGYDRNYGTSCGSGHFRLAQPRRLPLERNGVWSVMRRVFRRQRARPQLWPEGCDPFGDGVTVLADWPGALSADPRSDVVNCSLTQTRGASMACVAPYLEAAAVGAAEVSPPCGQAWKACARFDTLRLRSLGGRALCTNRTTRPPGAAGHHGKA